MRKRLPDPLQGNRPDARIRRPQDGRDGLVRLGRHSNEPRPSVAANWPSRQGAARSSRPRFPLETGTEFVHTAPQAQRDRPIPRHCGDRRTHRVRLRVPALPSVRAPDPRLHGARRRAGCVRRLRCLYEAASDRVRRGWRKHGSVAGHDRANRARPRERPRTAEASSAHTREGRVAFSARPAGVRIWSGEPSVRRDEPRHRLGLHPRGRPDRDRARELRASLPSALEHARAGRRPSRRLAQSILIATCLSCVYSSME